MSLDNQQKINNSHPEQNTNTYPDTNNHSKSPDPLPLFKPIATKPDIVNKGHPFLFTSENNFHKGAFSFISENNSNNNNNNYCTCKKNQCIKKYCDCYLNHRYCRNCRCENCLNVPGSNIKNYTENNFNKGIIICTCSKSNCNKKYCECFKANQKCNNKCRCVNCNNKENNSLPLDEEKNNKEEEKIEKNEKNDKIDKKDNVYSNFMVQRISVKISKTHTLINVEKLDMKDFNQYINKKRNKEK